MRAAPAAALTFVALLLPLDAPAQENLVVNGGFEQSETGWDRFWSRTGDGAVERVADPVHTGAWAAHVQYPGQQDWSLPQAAALDVQPGDIFELTGWIQLRGEGRATLSVILYDAQQQPLSWSFGGTTVRETGPWQRLSSRFMIPPGVARITPRLMGDGPSEVWLDDVSLIKTGTLDQLRARDLPHQLTISHAELEVTLRPDQATLAVTDRRSGHAYHQRADTAPILLSAGARDARIDFQLLEPGNMLTIHGTIRLEPAAAEFVVELQAEGPMREPLKFPLPFATEPGEYLIMPVNEGMSYPVDDPSLEPMRYHLAGGHGLCMAFWGATDLAHGLLAIVETPDDAAVHVTRQDGRLCLAPEWVPQKGQFGPARKIRYVLLDDGGYVRMCKRYREYAQQIGLFKTLAQKRAENPHVDLLVGAVNVWCWDRPGPEMCAEMQRLGIRRILWSNHSQPAEIQKLNDMNVLTSRYDIYQDLMDPANLPKLGYAHPDWTSEGWPHDIVLRADGSWEPGWAVQDKEGNWYSCGVLCDRVALDYARRRVSAELATHPYRCRFIDTTTASPWRECYSSDHPMTRTDSKRCRMELLEYISKTCGLVTGSETGHDAAVPYVHYFEGMLSLGPYRVPDAGRQTLRIWDEVPEPVGKFQTGHFYRLPLWELVYHECVVAQWYWGDYNNKLPALWQRRDLWNALYGTPPMFLLNREIWRQNRDRFVQSYRTATPVARATGYSEMISHQWLTDDHAVQQTKFANGVEVTVNFGQQPFTTSDGTVIEALTHHVRGTSEL